MRIIFLSSASALLAVLTMTQAEAGSFDRVTSAGETVRIASHATWDGDCVGGPSLVEIVDAPRHGRLFAKLEPTSIGRIEVGSPRCLGSDIIAKTVYYRPEPGFSGTDQFYYTSTTRSGVVISHQASVEVR